MDGEVLAGKVKVGFQDGLPVVLDVTEGKNSIRLTPSEGESFEKDKWYFIVKNYILKKSILINNEIKYV